MSGLKSKNPKKKAQAKKALPSGNQPQQGAGGGAGGAGAEISDVPATIDILLVKVSPPVWLDIEVGSPVKIVKGSEEFEVLFDGKRLGCVPTDYDELLAGRATYHGKVKYRRRKPIEVTVTVTVVL